MLYRLPLRLYQAGLGGLLGHRFVLIYHVGRRSGRWRQVVVEVAEQDRATGVITVMSGFGANADWYRNLLAHPGARIQRGSRSTDVHAVPLTPDEAGELLHRYAQRHPRAARALLRFLDAPADGSSSTNSYLAAGRQIPALRLEPAPARTDGG
jgi:deazaflavin-dependent oxidoreductase (nitroreductase family)